MRVCGVIRVHQASSQPKLGASSCSFPASTFPFCNRHCAGHSSVFSTKALTSSHVVGGHVGIWSSVSDSHDVGVIFRLEGGEPKVYCISVDASSTFEVGCPGGSPVWISTFICRITKKVIHKPRYILSSAMASMLGEVADEARSVMWPWYHDLLQNELTAEARQVLETYSGIAPAEVESHIYKIVGTLSLRNVLLKCPRLTACSVIRLGASFLGHA